ncbi:uncharacterized protein PHACADRAFT_255995 [Phanerochaete carnosa HHB-10118-sp]|uniref:Phytocyanin domain-containing protein n=1 Tax=Phanerochaete carnosa (strain HHB-10118-sp) TaxID=650164 RepID=K5W8V6_PHACS|nr:uncharacterized protein PHACADRAFT_255995 [Phanerochaete carnosa HHB-10118-sp]EKM55394.1 hypothetical protein PHACADRAFT_255995 [Phanerochaete carnosa HHB-10118-sp]
MVFIAPVLGAAALLAGLVSAAPRPDSSSGDEVAVSAPYGVIESDTAELYSQLATESADATSSSPYYAASATYAAAATGYAAAGGSYYSSSSDTWDSMATATVSAAVGGYYSSSSNTWDSMATATVSAAGSMMTYGSGSSGWGGQGYNDCVNQCVASYGAPPAMWTPTPSSGGSSSGSGSGSGTTHTVIVAPTQGVLRFVPFAVNATPGDTVHFVWNANNHTVTKSSELEICNKTGDAPFASGTQNQGFTFDQVVNDTNPVFYYCGTPTHCEKGMFGIINPPSISNNANTSVASMMPAMVANNSDLSAMAAYTNNMTQGNLQASMWGQNIDLAQMPDWSHEYVMQNVMYAQALIAENPDVIGSTGAIDMSAGGNPIKFPMDITSAINNAGSGSPSSSAGSAPSSSAPASSASASASASPSPAAGKSNGAGRTLASSALVGVAVIAASFLAL